MQNLALGLKTGSELEVAVEIAEFHSPSLDNRHSRVLLPVRAEGVDSCSTSLGLGSPTLLVEAAPASPWRWAGRLSRLGGNEPTAEPLLQAIERDLSVSSLRSCVVNHYSQLPAQSVDQLLADTWGYVTSHGKVDCRLHSGIGPIGMLATRATRGVKAPNDRRHRHRPAGKRKHPVHAADLTGKPQTLCGFPWFGVGF